MGVLNVTPDSFSDGGKFNNVDLALKRISEMLEQGADIIDIGAESTRPGAKKISVEEELQRLLPVLEAVSKQFNNIKISVDTRKSEVMAEVIKHDIYLINDISGIGDSNTINILKNTNAKVCIMHMQNNPESMQINPNYNDIKDEIFDFFSSKVELCLQNGIAKDRIVLDPGFGFGKNLTHNKILLKELEYFSKLGLPIMVGISRKSMLGEILNKDVNNRLYGSLAAAVIACMHGANIIRTHDVAATQDAIKVTEAIMDLSNE